MGDDTSRAPDLDLTTPPVTSPLSLYRYRDGLYAADLLTAALVEFDFFTWLAAEPATAETICRHFAFAARPADVMLTLFVAQGYIERRDGTYIVTALGREHLTTGSPWNLAPYFASLRERPIVRDFVEVLRSGRPARWAGAQDALDWHAAMETEAFARRFTAAMDCRGHYLGEVLTRSVDLAGRRRLLDVGGGSGIYACAFAARNPGLTATVLEQRPVDAIAATLITERGFAGRVDVVASDFMRAPLPEGFDVHLFSNVLHDWDTPDVQRLLEASARALAPGGLLVVHDAFINDDKSGPVAVAEYSAMLMHSTQGKCYATSEYSQMIRSAGFEQVTFTETVADRGVVTAKRAKESAQ